MNYLESYDAAKNILPLSGRGRNDLLNWIDQIQGLEISDAPGVSEIELKKIKTDIALLKKRLEDLG